MVSNMQPNSLFVQRIRKCHEYLLGEYDSISDVYHILIEDGDWQNDDILRRGPNERLYGTYSSRGEFLRDTLAEVTEYHPPLDAIDVSDAPVSFQGREYWSVTFSLIDRKELKRLWAAVRYVTELLEGTLPPVDLEHIPLSSRWFFRVHSLLKSRRVEVWPEDRRIAAADDRRDSIQEALDDGKDPSDYVDDYDEDEDPDDIDEIKQIGDEVTLRHLGSSFVVASMRVLEILEEAAVTSGRLPGPSSAMASTARPKLQRLGLMPPHPEQPNKEQAPHLTERAKFLGQIEGTRRRILAAFLFDHLGELVRFRDLPHDGFRDWNEIEDSGIHSALRRLQTNMNSAGSEFDLVLSLPSATVTLRRPTGRFVS